MIADGGFDGRLSSISHAHASTRKVTIFRHKTAVLQHEKIALKGQYHESRVCQGWQIESSRPTMGFCNRTALRRIPCCLSI